MSPHLSRVDVRVLLVLAACVAGAVAAGIAPTSRAAQQAPGSRAEGWARMSRDAEAKGTAEPFTGVTADGTVVGGLYGIRSTGVSTAGVQAAAASLLAALTPDQRQRSTFAVDDPEWRKWMNQHFYRRAGVSFEEMTQTQRDAAFALLKASLSARGLTLSRDIMRLNHTLGELNGNDFESYGEWLYHITVMGQPSATEPWGWQIDGHHLIVNYFVLGDQVVMTPSFFGSEPVVAAAGRYKGTRILQDEQAAGLAFVNGLDATQRARAILSTEKTGNDNRGEAFSDNAVIPYVGLPAPALTPAQRAQLLALVERYVGNMDDGHARVKMDEVRAHLDATHFAWKGGTTPGSVFYYRIHSPVILIEFDHQLPAGLRQLYPERRPRPDHVHVVIRTPNGNDYGKDLLRQHYAQHPHASGYGQAVPGLAVRALGPH